MQFTDAVTVAGLRRRDDGSLLADARIARTGVQTYLGSEVGKPDMAVVRVYRPGAEVFSEDTLKSAAHRPVTNDHPAELVTAGNWKQHAVGQTGDEITGEGIFIRVPLMVSDGATIADIENGKRELSAGYTCDLDWTAGKTPSGDEYDAIQKNIRINHVAIVRRGRAGSQVRIGDDAISWGASPVTTADRKEPDMPDNLRKVLVDGLQVETTDAGAQAIEKLQRALSDAQAKLTTAEATHKSAIEAKDTEIGTLKADLKKAQDAADVDVSKLVADRVALENQVRAIDSTIDPAGKSDDELRKATVAAKLGDEMVKDAQPAEIAGMFKALAKDAKPNDGKPNDAVRDALRTQDHSIAANDAWGDGVFASAGVDMKKGA